MAKIIVDAKGSVLGRISSYVAKELLKGNTVEVINSELVIISGDPKIFVEKVRSKIRMGQGSSLKGPKIIRKEDRLLKRIIRGMLPWDRAKGRAAYKNLRCHIGVGGLKEEELKNAKVFEIQKPRKYTLMKEIVRSLN